MDVMMEEDFLRDLNIDLKKYRKNPTEHETVRIFNYLINKILIDEPDVERSVPELYRIVNALLEKMQSTVKVFYSEFLEPKQSTVMAVCALGVHVCRQNALLSSEENNIITIINDAQEKVDELKQQEQQLQQLTKDLANYTEKLQHLEVANHQEDVCMLREQRHYEEEHEELRKQTDKLKQLQNINDLMNVQIEASKNNCETLDQLIEEKRNAVKKLSTYESKLRKLQQLTIELDSKPTFSAPASEVLDAQLVPTLKELNEDIKEVFELIVENNTLSDTYFELEKKISSLQKQIEEQQGRDKEDKELENELLSAVQEHTEDICISKAALLQGRKNTYKLYQHLVAINAQTRQCEVIIKENSEALHAANESYSSSIENNKLFLQGE